MRLRRMHSTDELGRLIICRSNRDHRASRDPLRIEFSRSLPQITAIAMIAIDTLVIGWLAMSLARALTSRM